jgi:hypothetical protein
VFSTARKYNQPTQTETDSLLFSQVRLSPITQAKASHELLCVLRMTSNRRYEVVSHFASEEREGAKNMLPLSSRHFIRAAWPTDAAGRPPMPLAAQSRPPMPARRSSRNASVVRWRSGSAERRNGGRKNDNTSALDASGRLGRRAVASSGPSAATRQPPWGSASPRRRCCCPIQGLRQAVAQFAADGLRVGAPCRGRRLGAPHRDRC